MLLCRLELSSSCVPLLSDSPRAMEPPAPSGAVLGSAPRVSSALAKQSWAAASSHRFACAWPLFLLALASSRRLTGLPSPDLQTASSSAVKVSSASRWSPAVPWQRPKMSLSSKSSTCGASEANCMPRSKALRQSGIWPSCRHRLATFALTAAPLPSSSRPSQPPLLRPCSPWHTLIASARIQPCKSLATLRFSLVHPAPSATSWRIRRRSSSTDAWACSIRTPASVCQTALTPVQSTSASARLLASPGGMQIVVRQPSSKAVKTS
mmetsp:Transcript_36107/g.107943  ORF Transcript_36107/g.107943 Transcript_36107/m.107943 type:complete len:266 (+) Transcript_36107:670-1467(+)